MGNILDGLKKEAIKLLNSDSVESINIYDWGDTFDVDIKIKKNMKENKWITKNKKPPKNLKKPEPPPPQPIEKKTCK